MRNLMIGAGLAALAATAIAAAPGGMGGKDMTRDEMVAKVREHFGQMDTNHDGVIGQDEMKAMRDVRISMRRGPDGAGMPGGDRMEKRDPNEAFDRIDANKDGTISRDEFAKGREVRIEKRIVMRDKAKGDKAGGGMRWHHRQGGGGMHMMGMADTDSDGRITLAEAQAMALKHFDQMDANRDGKVTADERRASWSAMKGKRDQRMEEHAPTAG